MFVAQKHHVTIVPSFSTTEPLHLITGQFGPFRSNQTIDVPFWLALELRQQGKCRLRPPVWLDVDELGQLWEIQKR
jgi:GINS complex subunit 2